jgi:REP element-mobilizing transposase RayT
MRYWFLTNTTYGTWLPGDPRGSIASVNDRRDTDPPGPGRIEHDQFGMEYEPSRPGLYRASQAKLKCPPIYLDLAQSELLLGQFRETATIRKWPLQAAAIMCNHFHLIVTVADDPDPQKILSDFKAYGSRKLNERFGKPASETWWTTNGSKRKLSDEKQIADTINYVLYKQPDPLVVWSATLGRLV